MKIGIVGIGRGLAVNKLIELMSCNNQENSEYQITEVKAEVPTNELTFLRYSEKEYKNKSK